MPNFNNTPMNPRVKALWLARLRDPASKQARGQLMTNEGMCCLGHLCEIHRQETDGIWNELRGNFNHHDFPARTHSHPFTTSCSLEHQSRMS